MNYGSQDIQQEGRISEVGSEDTGCEKQLEEGTGGVEEEAKRRAIINARSNEWKRNNKARTRETSRAYYLANKEKAAQKQRDRRILKDGDKICSVESCGRKVVAHGLCQPHYGRVWKNGKLDPEQPVSLARKGEKHAQWKGIRSKSGRFMLPAPGHPYARDGYVFRYRLVVEAHIGRYLLPSEDVHHINGNCQDDRIENLQVLSRSEHAKIHRALDRWSGHYNSCVICGTDQKRHRAHGLCRCCYKRLKTSGDLSEHIEKKNIKTI